MKAFIVTSTELEIARFIVDHLIDEPQHAPGDDHLHQLLQDQRTYLLAAQVGEEVVGYALAYRFPSLYRPDHLAYLYDIGVEEAYRKQGAGKLMINVLLPQLKADGVSELWLGTGTKNQAGQALFQATGAIKTDETFFDFTYHLGL